MGPDQKKKYPKGQRHLPHCIDLFQSENMDPVIGGSTWKFRVINFKPHGSSTQCPFNWVMVWAGLGLGGWFKPGWPIDRREGSHPPLGFYSSMFQNQSWLPIFYDLNNMNYSNHTLCGTIELTQETISRIVHMPEPRISQMVLGLFLL